MHIGVIDLDTSHPAAFLPLLRRQGHDVVAIYGGSTVVDDAYTRAYADGHGIAEVVTDPADLIGAVDAVFVHSVDWTFHVDRVRMFAEKDIPVHVCKPLAGSAADIRELTALAAAGARITGGSALRWSSAVQAWRREDRRPQTGFAVTFGHPLDYGIHAYSLLHGLFGPGVQAARALDDVGERVEVRWEDGRTAVVVVAPPGDGHGFFATLVTADGVHHVEASGADLYGPFLDAVVPYLAGHGELPITFDQLVEPELAAIAGRASTGHGGAWIGLTGDPRIDHGAFDSSAFVTAYRASRRRKLGLPPS